MTLIISARDDVVMTPFLNVNDLRARLFQESNIQEIDVTYRFYILLILYGKKKQREYRICIAYQSQLFSDVTQV